MKRTIMAAMVLSLLSGTVALADPPQDYHHDRDQRQERRHDGHHDRGEHRYRDEHHDRDYDHGYRDEHRGEMREHIYFNSGGYVRPYGWYEHRWHRGDRLPSAWRGPAYVIPDYAYYHLRRPPPGYYWVRVDGNAVLAAVATGIVVDVAYNMFR